MIKVLIIDDSAFMRMALKNIFAKDSAIEVVATAINGVDGLKKIEKYRPDVVTLDVEMPEMDGLTALRHIMTSYPLPVVMISSYTKQGAQTTLEALDIGAVDFVEKPSGAISVDIAQKHIEIIQKVRLASTVKCEKLKRGHDRPQEPVKKAVIKTNERPQIAVAIGVSTGGPQTLLKILPALPADLPAAVFIVQHLPPVFTKNFADRLNKICPMYVKEAENMDKILNGTIYIAPGDYHMVLNPASFQIETPKHPSNTLHRPSVDVMINSVADMFKKHVVGVILTGMGRDGAQGLKKVRDYGGKTIAESENTAVIYGMPREAVKIGAVEHILDNTVIADKIVELVNTSMSIKR